VRAEKQYMVDDIRRQLTGSDFAFFVDYTRLTVDRMSELRQKLRACGAEIHVVRNRLLKLVVTELGWSGMESVVRKPTALVTGKNECATAKAIQVFAKAEERPLSVKGGMLKGSMALNGGEVLELANLPAREVLYAQVAGTIAAPMTRLVGVMQRKVSSLLCVLKAVEQKKGGQ